MVPRRLAHANVYHGYYYGRDYFRPHRHYHRIYLFPVLFDDVWIQRPYYYCEDALYGYGALSDRGPHFTFRLSF